MGINPHNRISTEHQKFRGRACRGCRTVLNKREGGMLYQKMCNLWLLIPSPLMTFVKQPGPTGVTPTMILGLLPDQDSTHDLINAKKMANKTNPYWKNRPGRSLLPDTCNCENRINMHCNSWRAILSLPEVTLWHHTRTRRICEF